MAFTGKLWSVRASTVIESREYATDVIRAYNGSEQRVSQRGMPREGVKYGFAVLEPSEGQLFRSLIHGGQVDDVLGVPLWQYGSRISGALSIGGSSVVVSDVALIPYVTNGFAVLWANPFSYEVVQILSIVGTTINFAAGVASAWPDQTYIFPMRLGRASERAQNHADSSRVFGAEMDFELDNAVIPIATLTVASIVNDSQIVVVGGGTSDAALRVAADSKFIRLQDDASRQGVWRLNGIVEDGRSYTIRYLARYQGNPPHPTALIVLALITNTLARYSVTIPMSTMTTSFVEYQASILTTGSGPGPFTANTIEIGEAPGVTTGYFWDVDRAYVTY